jgi:hypothetical protein
MLRRNPTSVGGRAAFRIILTAASIGITADVPATSACCKRGYNINRWDEARTYINSAPCKTGEASHDDITAAGAAAVMP